MKTFRISAAVIAAQLLFTALGAHAQSTKLELNYAAGIPTGQFKNIAGDASFRGAEAALLFDVSQKVSVGVQTGFQDFYQKFPRQVYHEGSGSDISAVVTNSIQVIPIMAKVRYKMATLGVVEPYVSLAAGGNLVSYNKLYGQFSDSKASFGFAAQPEIGLHVPFTASRRSGFHLAAGYNYMPFSYNDADGLHHAVIKAGVTFTLQ